MNYFVYILRCNDDSLYTGITTDIRRRLQEHNGELDGGAKYTAARIPVKIVYHKEFLTRSLAQKEEWRIKHMTKKNKEQFVLSL